MYFVFLLSLKVGGGEDNSEVLNKEVKLKASLKPDLENVKSYDGCPVLSFAVSLKSRKTSYENSYKQCK